MDFIHKHEVPNHKLVKYVNFVCNYRPLKSEPFRVQMTVGGDKLSYDNDTGSLTASLIEAKLLANSVISDHKKYNSKFCAIDLKYFFEHTYGRACSPMAYLHTEAYLQNLPFVLMTSSSNIIRIKIYNT